MKLALAILLELRTSGKFPIRQKLLLANVRIALNEPPTDEEFFQEIAELVKIGQVAILPNEDTGARYLISSLGEARLIRAGL